MHIYKYVQMVKEFDLITVIFGHAFQEYHSKVKQEILWTIFFFSFLIFQNFHLVHMKSIHRFSYDGDLHLFGYSCTGFDRLTVTDYI